MRKLTRTSCSSAEAPRDRVGLGWRPELGLGILERIDQIDILELTAENCARLRLPQLKTFARLAAQIPIELHALSLGLASTYPVDHKHVEMVARVVEAIQPETWTEHLAFVRTDTLELGHLAAPPWSEETVASTLSNIEAACAVIGTKPHLENIATLYHPLGSTLSEQEWTRQIVLGADTGLLLDVENVFANSTNFGREAFAELMLFPLERVRYVHIAGGREVEDAHGKYFLDDHQHPVSEQVFQLLEHLAAHTTQSLTVILERDGNFPNFDETQAELLAARDALRRGRASRLVPAHAL